MPDYRTVTAPGGDDIHLGAIEFWRRPLDERHDAFAALRAESRGGDGMCFHEELSVIEGGVKGPGFWSAVTYEDVRAINRNPFVFSSASGITLGEQPPETLEFFGSMIVMDDPRHAKFRLLVQKGFTPKTVAGVETSVRARAQTLVEQAKQTGGACDFVQQFAAPLPLQVICDMLGVPAEDEAQILEWTNHILGAGDPDFTLDLDGLILAAAGMFEYAQALGQDRLEFATRRHHLDPDARRGGRAAADAGRVRFVLHPPRRRGQRDDTQRDLVGDAPADEAPRPARAAARQLRRPGVRAPRTRSCAGRRR